MKIGNTPLKKYSYKDKIFYVKHEESNLNGSFKDRSLSYQIQTHINNGKNKFVISSSGNAAVSAASYVSSKSNVKLDIFVSIHVDKIKLDKLKKLESKNIILHQTKKPKSDAIMLAKDTDATDLRGSQDDLAIIGYKDISTEIYAKQPNIDAIFIPCSSGTSTLGIYQQFHKLGINPAIHICQNTKIHPMAKFFDTDAMKEETHLATAIADRVAHRKNDVIAAIQLSHGFGWVISNQDLLNAQKIANKIFPSNISYNSLLSFAGYLKSLDKGYTYVTPILLFSGI